MRRTITIRVDPEFYQLVLKTSQNKKISIPDATKLITFKLKSGVNFTTTDWL